MRPEIIFENQQKYYNTGKTKAVASRKEQLRKLRNAIRSNEEELYQAVAKDFGKSSFETYATELGLLYQEIKKSIKRVHAWSSVKRVRTNWPNLPGKSYLKPEPYGISLIIGTWNYPFLLTLQPLVSAIAAGNTAVIKPSELAPNSSAMIAKLINNTFDPDYIFVAQGDAEVAMQWLKLPFDKIFYTGSPEVGRYVMKAAADHLSSVTLELGGKSPAIVCQSANIQTAARRIAWAKFLNAGQTCIAPDYVLIHEHLKEEFIGLVIAEIYKNQGEDPRDADTYTRIINQRHLLRLQQLIDTSKVRTGGRVEVENNYLEPTVMDDVSFKDPVMQEEIFGPVLPVITFSQCHEVIQKVNSLPKPLALYVFTKDKAERMHILDQISFGGGAVNDAMMHITNPYLPFGGVNHSGMGAYHGKAGFDAFTHYKSILQKNPYWELKLKYPPYSKFKMKLLRRYFE
ncbi:MAG: aldehyde dehydrogenase [Bacteroidales bacterium]